MQGPADIWKPALITGAAFGFASGLPLLGFLNCACCSLVIGAGAAAAFMMVKGSAAPLTYGRAALAGTISGVIAALTQTATSLLITVALQGGSPTGQLEEAFDKSSQYLPNAEEAYRLMRSVPAAVWIVLSAVVLMILYAPIGALGGVIGRALFEKRAAPPGVTPAVPDAGGPASAGPTISS